LQEEHAVRIIDLTGEGTLNGDFYARSVPVVAGTAVAATGESSGTGETGFPTGAIGADVVNVYGLALSSDEDAMFYVDETHGNVCIQFCTSVNTTNYSLFHVQV
jgi:hypothetical protein